MAPNEKGPGSLHAGHRQRVKDRFRQEGESHFSDRQLLELFLFYSKPQGDVNPLVNRLFDQFASLDGIFNASMADLMSVPGVGEHTALHIRLMPVLMRRYLTCASRRMESVQSSAQAGEYLLPYFCATTREVIYLLCLDSAGRVLACEEVGSGATHSALLDLRQVVSLALKHRSSAVYLAHNHPGGRPIPSQADFAATRRLIQALEYVQVNLVDHLVVADEDFTSIRQARPDLWMPY